MAKVTFTFDRVQRGSWGETILSTVVVKAKDVDKAWAKIQARKDYLKRLRNGDRIHYCLSAVE